VADGRQEGPAPPRWGGFPRTALAGRLTARPSAAPTAPAPAPGEHPLELAEGRDGTLYVPAAYHPDRPAPLLLCLHGAGQTGARAVRALRAQADGAGLVLVGPDARGRTWDVLLGGYGPDVAFIDRALAVAFARLAIDPARLAVEGFSDGASYALSLGLANGDLFTHVLAFSPGFMAPPGQVGAPRIYVSHGTKDPILPIDRCSRRLVPVLRRAGYDVRYHEFDGPHTVPPEVVAEAVGWLVGDGRVGNG
jgi:phospholipase/carboxylesterase